VFAIFLFPVEEFKLAFIINVDVVFFTLKILLFRSYKLIFLHFGFYINSLKAKIKQISTFTISACVSERDILKSSLRFVIKL
jgi:hypothetical protein